MARRILVALESSEDSRAALEAAARLAAEREAELVALFIEDVEFLSAAALPFSRALNLQSFAWQSLDAESMQRALAARAEELRRATEAAARRWRVRWSFRVVRGTARERLPQETEGFELVVVGRTNRVPLGRRPLGGTARQTVVRSTCSVFVLHAPSEFAGRVVAVYRGSPRALEAAEELARIFGQRLEVAVVADDIQQGRRLEAQATQWLRQHDAEAAVSVLQVVDAETLADALERRRGTLAVIDAATDEAAEIDLGELLDRIECPALVVRASPSGGER